MAFFQNSVINKYIQNLDKQTLQNAYVKFRAHFHNAAIQENIRDSKEEQYQGEFLIDLFVNVLGYTKNPTPNFNLTTEYKNVKDSKKADGAIIINEIVKAVIELKGTNTTDLNKIEVQAFGYKNNQPECEYVITSNFEKLRFYVDNAIEYLEFNLFTLTEKEFELLYICLSYDSIAKGLPKQIKDESVSQEDLITKKLYKDYSFFKNELYHSLVKLNPQYEPLELFKKSQKLLDRFLFIFFAEDRQLLPTNLIFRINKEWQQLREMRIEVSLYDRYKIYFKDLDQGATVSLPAFSQTASKQKEEFQIYAYNGGLFKTDDLLNDIKIEDDLLFSHTEKLSNYDFASEVDVNVLGHIFENSLNDVDEIKAQLEGQEIDKTKTKRKKDGVFYTPKYITKYIVDNTVGKLCLEKKEALQLIESDYTIDKKRQKKTTQSLTDKLNEYRNWLLQLTICDPACGSGAFLNQALDFLITEHKYIDELQAKLFGDALVLSDVEGSILENNLFGVDINEESVEIAKLSLWLRTAQPNRKLNDLNSNIKCGNSLIDDVAVAGDKAFNWFAEFPKVFPRYKGDKNYIPVNDRITRTKITDGDELGKYKDDGHGLLNEFHEPPAPFSYKADSKGFENGGFDVIIGNPPYLRVQGLKEHYFDLTKYYESNFKSATGNYDIYALFLEKSFKLISVTGIVSFILPHKFLVTDFGKGIRSFFIEHNAVESVVHFGSELIFSDAATYTCIINLSKQQKENVEFLRIKTSELFDKHKWEKISYKKLSSSNWDLQSADNHEVITKLNKQPYKIEDVFDRVFTGIQTSADKIFVLKLVSRTDTIGIFYSDILQGNIEIEMAMLKPFIKGNEISRFKKLVPFNFIIFPYLIDNGKSKPMNFEHIIKNYPLCAKYLFDNKSILSSRDKNKFDNEKEWFQFSRNQGISNVEIPKIMTQEISLGCNMTFDEYGEFYHPTTVYSFVKNKKFNIDDKYYLAILNSKIMWFFLKNTGTELGGGYFRFKTNYLKPFPLPGISNNSNVLINSVNSQLNSNKELQSISRKFQNSLKRKFVLDDISQKLENWYLLSYSDFIKELAKKKIKLSLSDEAEWEEYFNTESKKALELKSKIDATDKEIDQMVYKLYDLTEEEIKIVEGN